MLKIVAGASLIACLLPAAALAGGRRVPAEPTDFRLHATVAATPARRVLIDGPGGRLRTGFGNGLVEFYPLRKSGLHLSGGGRLYGRAARPRADNEQARLLAGPRGTGLKNTRRSAPAALVGFARNVGQRLALGIDGGAALGRLNRAPDRLGPIFSNRGSNGDGRLNEIGRITMRYRF